jgi:hypothetical protein
VGYGIVFLAGLSYGFLPYLSQTYLKRTCLVEVSSWKEYGRCYKRLEPGQVLKVCPLLGRVLYFPFVLQLSAFEAMNPDVLKFPLLNKYAGFSSKAYNDSLRRDPTPTSLDLEKRVNLELDRLAPYVNELAYAHDMHTSIPFEVLSKWYSKRIGCVIEFPNFLSSSNFRWLFFDGTVYEIRTSNKSKARYINLVVAKDSEKEVLFKSRSLFQIEKVDINTNTIYLNEVDESDVKITLVDGAFLLDDEIEKLLYPNGREDNSTQLSASDLGWM